MALPHLPTAVLYNIAQAVVDEFGVLPTSEERDLTRCTLLTLRETCKDFAIMGNIKTVLFRKISLHATEDNLNQLRQTNMAAFANFVQAIDFYPSPYPVYPEFQVFKASLDMRTINIATRKICHTCNHRPREEHMSSHNCGRHACAAIDATYHALWTCAQKDTAVVGTGALQKAWAETLSAFENADVISLRPLVGDRGGDSSKKFEVVVPTNRDCCAWLVTIESQSMGNCGDLLFRAVIQALSSTGRLIKTFSLACELSTTFENQGTEPYWDGLSLKGLESLEVLYMPSSRIDTNDYFPGNGPSAFHFLVEQSQHTLQHLKLIAEAPRIPMKWPLNKWDFPKLRELEFQGFNTIAGGFANDIFRFQTLERVIIKCYEPYDDDVPRSVFDAIRGNPNILHVEIGDIPLNFKSVTHWSLTFDILDEIDVQSTTGPVEDMKRSLRLYLSRKGDWDDILDRFFPDW
ncbi:hypothetical protein LTR47_005500 [Exophiala xenobiotica]|nr:hypothetical protein LTR47_005500 [Exophiala xenobiotica]KAK5247092.1 hypothetical protein LTS06_007712 [Exophiala xenobiotica]KAK5282410.1 hypothetical protein LTR40_003345 [Exophiala xenobiotica]KAK5349294.1 hypothetical protein LTR61_007332 [Exophiala xenobiotica]KAK5365228.1 hypothetical protein LTR11_008638 [Exophiala xenobiotica]